MGERSEGLFEAREWTIEAAKILACALGMSFGGGGEGVRPNSPQLKLQFLTII